MVRHPFPAVPAAAAQRAAPADEGLAGDSCTLYGVLLVLQILFYVLGLWGYYLSTKQIKNKLLFIPYYFLFMNVNVLKGIGYLKKKRGTGVWEKAKRSSES